MFFKSIQFASIKPSEQLILRFLDLTNDIKRLNDYGSSYIDSVRKHFHYVLVEYKYDIHIKDEQFLAIINQHQEYVYVTVNQIKKRMLEITYLSDYPLRFMNLDSQDKVIEKTSIDWAFLHEDYRGDNYFIIGFNDTFCTDSSFVYCFRQDINEADLSKLVLIDYHFTSYKINEYKLIDKNFYVVWKKDKDNVVEELHALLKIPNYTNFNNIASMCEKNNIYKVLSTKEKNFE